MTDPDAAFRPSWISPPGDTIFDILSDRSISLSDFARLFGCTRSTAERIIEGSAAIDEAVALKLEHLLGPSCAFWMSRESEYRSSPTRHTNTSASAIEQAWLRTLPIRDMRKFGWLQAGNSHASKLNACLEFFGVPDLQAWHSTYRGILSVASFRTSPTLHSNPVAVAAWLRRAEVQSMDIPCAGWNSDKFRAAIPKIRLLTRQKDPNAFWPQLRRLCAECGVAVVHARAPEGCRASGATRFLSETKAVIVLSFRYLSDDHFWFTFFHEAAHLLLHSKDAVFIEDESEVTSQEENEANEFAARVLIPSQYQLDFGQLRPQVREILRFARRLQISPGIVVGQLQYTKRIKPNRLNGLKRRFAWTRLNFQPIPETK